MVEQNPQPAVMPVKESETIELSVVMPCLNEAETLETCIRKAQRALREANVAGEVIVADNGSNDGSVEIAERVGARVVHMKARGYGNALMGGIAAARGKYIVMGDADDSYDFGHIVRFLEPLREGADLVMGIASAEASRRMLCRLCTATSVILLSPALDGCSFTVRWAISIAVFAGSAKTPTSAWCCAPPAWSSPPR